MVCKDVLGDADHECIAEGLDEAVLRLIDLRFLEEVVDAPGWVALRVEPFVVGTEEGCEHRGVFADESREPRWGRQGSLGLGINFNSV